MNTPFPARKRTQFASFLTDAASDLSGFQASGTAVAGSDANTTPAKVASHGEFTDKPVSALDRAGSPNSAIKHLSETSAPAELPPSDSQSERLADGPPGTANEASTPSPKIDLIKISVKVDADTFLELKRALHLRETLQDFCLNAITRELANRVGKT